jgi:hypothetical protein
LACSWGAHELCCSKLYCGQDRNVHACGKRVDRARSANCDLSACRSHSRRRTLPM